MILSGLGKSRSVYRKHPLACCRMRRTPVGNLEWALLADGVEPDSVYRVLESDDGVQRALSKLQTIKAVTRWWTDGEQAIAWLEQGEIRMGSVYNGRVYDAVQRGAKVRINWDRQLTSFNVWGVSKNGRNAERAFEFIQFATSSRSLARQTEYIPYGPVRKSSAKYVSDAVKPYLPATTANMETAFAINSEWWSHHLERISSQFERWLRSPSRVPRQLPR